MAPWKIRYPACGRDRNVAVEPSFYDADLAVIACTVMTLLFDGSCRRADARKAWFSWR